MCGFFLSINDARVDIRRMTESIKHRGPDSTKYYFGPRVLCGFNRLAIVDDDPGSDQPMVDWSGRYLLAFNGEIYNHAALRADLERSYSICFRTRSDTEVLLNGLKHEGASYVSKLDGIFAFAFVDLHTCEVIVARDVFGVKPLYYYSHADRLYVSSEIKPLRQVSGNNVQLSSVAKFLSYGAVGNGDSLVSGVKELEPNTVRSFSADLTSRTTTIHRFDYDQCDNMEVDEIGRELYRSIDGQKPSIPYGVLFSGGLDSTLILDRCYSDDHFAGAYSVDVNHAEMSEKHWQEYVVDTLKISSQYRRIDLARDDFALANIATIAQGLDCPLFHPNFIGSYLLTRAAGKDGLKVLLSGEGADELFLGYKWFFAECPSATFLEYVPLLELQRILGTDETPAIDTFGMSRLEVFQKIYLQRWLVRQDVTGMANSVEVRVPFLGLELAKVMNKLSFRFKKANGESKWIIKRLLSYRYSKEFLERKKVGFDFPLNDWIGSDHLDLLRHRTDLFDQSALNAILKKYEGSFVKNRLIFSLVSLALWHESECKDYRACA